jgi:hypothetical protein
MSTTSANGKELLDAVKEMSPAEFAAFLDQAFSVRRQGRPATLSAAETRLIKRINRGLPAKLLKRYSHLVRRRQKATLTDSEHAELLQLTHQAESQDADRAAALLELSKIRCVPLRTLMKQMGIRTPALHG